MCLVVNVLMKYLVDMVCMDFGHMGITDVSFLEYMPNLEYLDVAMNHLVDLEPLASCKNLKFLVMFDQLMELDYTPLKECTALVDLNISKGHGDISPILEMTWLNNLWLPNNVISKSTKDLLTSSLPNTRVEFNGWHTGGDWRKLDNYFKMRDILGQPYNTW